MPILHSCHQNWAVPLFPLLSKPSKNDSLGFKAIKMSQSGIHAIRTSQSLASKAINTERLVIRIHQNMPILHSCHQNCAVPVFPLLSKPSKNDSLGFKAIKMSQSGIHAIRTSQSLASKA